MVCLQQENVAEHGSFCEQQCSVLHSSPFSYLLSRPRGYTLNCSVLADGMAWEHLIGRKFAKILPELEMTSEEPYINESGVPGCRLTGLHSGRTFYVSQSRTTQMAPLRMIAKVLANGDNIDVRKSALYRNRELQEGLRVEAWDGSTWFQVFTPDSEQQPDDEFRQIIFKIYSEQHKSLDGFKELLRVIETLKGRR